jgi:diamine N-acetyltransferase
MLSGKKIYLRALEPSDADMILRWENNPDNWSVSNTLVPFSRKLIEDYVSSAQDIYSVKQVRFIICLVECDREVGAIYLTLPKLEITLKPVKPSKSRYRKKLK